MPIKRKLRYWALVAPLLAFFILSAVIRPGHLGSVGAVLLLATGLYLVWAGAYWTLLQIVAFLEKHDPAGSVGEEGGWQAQIGAAAHHLKSGAARVFERLGDLGSRPQQARTRTPPSATRKPVSGAADEVPDEETDLLWAGHSHGFRAIEDVDRRLSPGVSAPPRSLQGVPAAHADVVQAIEEFRDVLKTKNKAFYRASSHYVDAVLRRDMNLANRYLKDLIIPNAPKDLHDRIMHAGGGSKFAGGMDLRRAGLVIPEDARMPDAIFIGETDPATVNPPAPIVHQGEGHILTIASTGSGKGQCYILPTLMTYAGPVICLDPKGENYRTTKGQRDLFGRVFKWAPFDRADDTDCFNPIDAIEDWDDARVVADLLIAPADSGEKRFWDQSARDFVRGLIMYVRTLEPERRNMREVVRILYASEGEHDALRERLAESDDRMLVELANQFEVMADRMFSSILQSARAELDVWRSEAIAKTTSTTSERWHVGLFVAKLRMHEVQIALGQSPGPLGYQAQRYADGTKQTNRGPSDSVFFVIPPDRVRSYASVLRVLLGAHLNAWSRAESLLEEDTAEHQPLYQVPALFVFDELAQLGHMPIIEDQIAIARSAKIRMWLIAQDLPQLKRTYPRWESMLGNCRTQILFGVNDLETATYVSHRAGDKTTVYEETRPLVTPTELMGPTFVDKAIIFARGTPPIQAYLPTPYHADEDMREIERFLDHWDATLTRRERTEETTSASEDADDDENVDETGGEAEVEEADCVDQLEGDDRGSSMVTAEADVPLAEDSRIGVGAATEGKTTEPRGTSRRSARTGPNNRPRKPVPKSSKANVSASQPSAPRKKPRPRKRPAPPSSGDE